MNWLYFTGLVTLLVLVAIGFALGWISGHSAGHKKGFNEGWVDGQDSMEKKLTEQFNLDPNPFRQRMLDAQRSHVTRPDSAGPVRIHRARLRGDTRLPQNNPDKRELPKPTKPTISD